MSFNWFLFIAVVVIQYVIGGLWYSVIFGKQWLQINHQDGLPSKEEQTRLEKEAMPYYGIQLVLTIVTVLVQSYFVAIQPANWFMTSMLIWLGFIAPTVVQGVIWSDPKNKKKAMQIGILALNYLVTIIIAGWLLATFR
jgi:Protein of unknown function (DUF1761)